jgi:hypothetical protein
MKKKELVLKAKAYAESIGNEDGTSAYDYVMGYNQCQEDMDRKEIQPEDIWNKENQDKIKEHIKSVSKNQSFEEILETELMAKKYTEEDLRKAIEVGVNAEAGDYPKGFTHKLGISLEDYFINSLNKQD